jgi:hypothetical protein
MTAEPPPTPDEDLPQDAGIPGRDVISDESDASLPDEKDAEAEGRERLDDADHEGHMTATEPELDEDRPGRDR